MEPKDITKTQLELLNAFPYLKIDEAIELKETLANFFEEEAQKEMDRLWASGEWNLETLEALKTQHLRTPYK